MKVSEDDSLIVQYILDHTPENAIVFLTGVGKGAIRFSVRIMC